MDRDVEVKQETPIHLLIVLALALGLFSAVVLPTTGALFAQGQNQTGGNQTNQTGEAMQTAGNKTVGGLQTVGNKTGEGLQAAANETGKLLGNVSKGAQEFFNKGGQ
jgi:hypothetical protein